MLVSRRNFVRFTYPVDVEHEDLQHGASDRHPLREARPTVCCPGTGVQRMKLWPQVGVAAGLVEAAAHPWNILHPASKHYALTVPLGDAILSLKERQRVGSEKSLTRQIFKPCVPCTLWACIRYTQLATGSYERGCVITARACFDRPLGLKYTTICPWFK